MSIKRITFNTGSDHEVNYETRGDQVVDKITEDDSGYLIIGTKAGEPFSQTLLKSEGYKLDKVVEE